MLNACAPSTSNCLSRNSGEVLVHVLQVVCVRMFADTGNNLKVRLEESLNRMLRLRRAIVHNSEEESTLTYTEHLQNLLLNGGGEEIAKQDSAILFMVSFNFSNFFF